MVYHPTTGRKRVIEETLTDGPDAIPVIRGPLTKKTKLSPAERRLHAQWSLGQQRRQNRILSQARNTKAAPTSSVFAAAAAATPTPPPPPRTTPAPTRTSEAPRRQSYAAPFATPTRPSSVFRPATYAAPSATPTRPPSVFRPATYAAPSATPTRPSSVFRPATYAAPSTTPTLPSCIDVPYRPYPSPAPRAAVPPVVVVLAPAPDKFPPVEEEVPTAVPAQARAARLRMVMALVVAFLAGRFLPAPTYRVSTSLRGRGIPKPLRAFEIEGVAATGLVAAQAVRSVELVPYHPPKSRGFDHGKTCSDPGKTSLGAWRAAANAVLQVPVFFLRTISSWASGKPSEPPSTALSIIPASDSPKRRRPTLLKRLLITALAVLFIAATVIVVALRIAEATHRRKIKVFFLRVKAEFTGCCCGRGFDFMFPIRDRRSWLRAKAMAEEGPRLYKWTAALAATEQGFRVACMTVNAGGPFFLANEFDFYLPLLTAYTKKVATQMSLHGEQMYYCEPSIVEAMVPEPREPTGSMYVEVLEPIFWSIILIGFTLFIANKCT